MKKKAEISGRSVARITLVHFSLLIFFPVPAESAFSICQPVNKRIKRLVTLAKQAHSTLLEVLGSRRKSLSISGHKAQPALLECPVIGKRLSKHAELRPLNPSRRGAKPKFQQKLPSSAVIATVKIVSQYKREKKNRTKRKGCFKAREGLGGEVASKFTLK